jgi:hypothetical protein
MDIFDGWDHKDWIQLVQAFAAMCVVFVAVFQDSIRAWLTSPKAIIRLANPLGSIVPTTGNGKVLYYHLVVENKRPSYPLESASVVCTAFSKFPIDGKYIQQSIVPLKLRWPNEDTSGLDLSNEPGKTIVREDYCDLGYLFPSAKEFCLSFQIHSFSFDGRIKANEEVWIALEVRARNYQSKAPVCFKIRWDGKWDDDMNVMAGHLEITQIEWNPPRNTNPHIAIKGFS